MHKHTYTGETKRCHISEASFFLWNSKWELFSMDSRMTWYIYFRYNIVLLFNLWQAKPKWEQWWQPSSSAVMQESGYGSESSATARSAPGVAGTLVALRSRTETIREGSLSRDQPPRRVTQQQRKECDSGRTKAAEKTKRSGEDFFSSVGKWD